jgi:hypothetical protein
MEGKNRVSNHITEITKINMGIRMSLPAIRTINKRIMPRLMYVNAEAPLLPPIGMYK